MTQRFNMYVLEHEYQWLTGHPVQLFSPPLFYPFPDTLFFSDTHLGVSFIYATFRLLGFSDYQAFGLWFVTGYFLTFWATYYVMARLGFGPVECGVAAAIFAFSLPSIAQIGHAQFAYRVGIPFAVLYTFEVLERADPSCGFAALAWLFVQILSSWYLGFFLAMLMVAMAVSYVLITRRNPVRWGAHLYANTRTKLLQRDGTLIASFAAAVVLGGAASALLLGYHRVSELYGYHRTLTEIAFFQPRLASYLIADGLPYWSKLPFIREITVPARNEQQLFVGMGSLTLLVIGIAASIRSAGSTNQKLVSTSLLSTLFLILIVTSFNGASLYRLLYTLPAFDSVRAIGRVILVLTFPISIACAAGLAFLFSRSGLFPKAMGVGLAGLFLWETAALPKGAFDARADAERVEAIIAEARASVGTIKDPILHVTAPLGVDFFRQELDAMLAAQRLGWPTVEGQSGYASPVVAGGCVKPLKQYWSFTEWSLKRGLEISQIPHKLRPDSLLRRTIAVGSLQCPSLRSLLPALPKDWQLKWSTGPRPKPEIAPHIELQEVGFHVFDKEIVAIVKIRNGSKDYLASLSSAPLRLSWRFLDLNGGPLSDWNTRQPISTDIPPGGESLNIIDAMPPDLPGTYKLQISLVAEGKFWFHDHGMSVLTFAEPIVWSPKWQPGSSAGPGSFGAILKEGWSQQEIWGVWSEGDHARLSLPVYAGEFPAGARIELELTGFAPLEPRQITLVAPEVPPVALRLGSQPQTVTIEVPSSALSASKPLGIDFQIPNPVSPRSLGLSQDSRLLGVGLLSVSVTSQLAKSPK